MKLQPVCACWKLGDGNGASLMGPVSVIGLHPTWAVGVVGRTTTLPSLLKESNEHICVTQLRDRCSDY